MNSSTENMFEDTSHQSAASSPQSSDDYPFCPESKDVHNIDNLFQPISTDSAFSSSPYVENNRDEGKDLAGFRIRRIMRWVGYGLFILYWVDVGYILYPTEFTNIVWEYQAMGDLVRLVPTLAISFILIFYGFSNG